MDNSLIKRQEAIDALADYIHNVDRVYSTGLLSTTDCMDAARSVLDDLPSAPPEELTCDGCKYEKTKIFNGMCEYCSRGYDDYYEDGES